MPCSDALYGCWSVGGVEMVALSVRANRKGDAVDRIGEVSSGGGLQGRAIAGLVSGYVCGG